MSTPCQDLLAAQDVRRQLEDAVVMLEQELFNQEQLRVRTVNELRLANGQVAELADRVSKARLKETTLQDKVNLWVQYLKEEKMRYLMKESRKCAGQAEELDEAINYHCDWIVVKRQAVERCLAETRARRGEHKNYLRMLKGELEELQSRLKQWDSRGQEVTEATVRLGQRRQKLEEQLAEKRRVEFEERTRYQQLEAEMTELVKKYKRVEYSLSFEELQVSQTTEDGSTTLAEGILADIRRLRDRYEQ